MTTYLQFNGTRIRFEAPFLVTGNQGPVTFTSPMILSGNPYESIISKITSNRKSALAQICLANGYTFTPAFIEEERSELDFSQIPFIRLVRLAGEIDPDANYSDETTIRYCVFYYDMVSDTGTDPITNAMRQEATYQHRNIIADIKKAWMTDIYCGELAENTKEAVWSDGIDEMKLEGGGSVRYYCSMNIFEVTARINSRDPYLLA